MRDHLLSADSLKSAAVLATTVAGLLGLDAKRQQGEHGSELKLQGVMAAVTYESERGDSLTAEVTRLRQRMRIIEAHHRRSELRLPENAIGPALPPGWLKRPHKPSWWQRHFGGH